MVCLTRKSMLLMPLLMKKSLHASYARLVHARLCEAVHARLCEAGTCEAGG